FHLFIYLFIFFLGFYCFCHQFCYYNFEKYLLISEKKCPAGWMKFKYSCYFTSSEKNTWEQSREFCRNKTGDLAIINSEEEMAFINTLCKSGQQTWIGLTDGEVEGQWKWVDGTPLTLIFWGTGQPNSYQGSDQDCVEFWHRSKGIGDWNDESCSNTIRFVFKKKK
uniref:C-type lectin domain-containing protein n=1 Tax=Oryzias sinensis TaxID=183150 RepID=A0A8C7X8Q4_9TELE